MSNFKRYDKYKNSGIDWIGKIPEGWRVSKIKFTTYVRGRIGWQGLRADEFIDEGPYLVTGTDFIDGLVNWDSCYHISMARYNEAPPIQLKEDDLLITKDGTIGKIAIVRNKPKYAILNSGIFVVRPLNSAYLTKFMYWILNSQVFNRYIEYMSFGSTIIHLYQQTFENFSFPIPSFNEQKAIANFLDQKTAEIDDLIAYKEKLIELLQEKRQAVITETVTKGLNPNAKMKDSGIEWIGKIPEHWRLSKIKYESLINNKILSESTDDDYEIDYIDISSVTSIGEIDGVQSFNFKDAPSRARRILSKGDVIVSTVRTYLKAIAFIENTQSNLICSTGFAVLTSLPKVVPKYLFYLMRSEKYVNEIVRRSVGVSYPAVNASDIGDLECALPDRDEQMYIVEYLDNCNAQINQLVNDIQQQIQKLKEYRQSLIFEVVTGKIDVRDCAAVS